MRSDRGLMAAAAGLGALLLAAWLLPAPGVPASARAAALGSALSTLDDARAQGVLEAGLKQDATDPLLNLALARLAMRDERFKDADAHLKQAEATRGDELEVRLARVDWLVATGQGARALAQLEALDRAHPQDPRVPLAQAEALRRLMRFKASLPYYEKYLALPDPDKHRRDVHKLRFVRIVNALQEFEAQTRKGDGR